MESVRKVCGDCASVWFHWLRTQGCFHSHPEYIWFGNSVTKGQVKFVHVRKINAWKQKNLFQDKWWSAAAAVKILKRKMFFKSSDLGRWAILFPKGVVFCGKFVTRIDKGTNFLEFVSSSGKYLVCPGPDCLRQWHRLTRLGLLLIESSEIHFGGIPTYISDLLRLHPDILIQIQFNRR